MPELPGLGGSGPNRRIGVFIDKYIWTDSAIDVVWLAGHHRQYQVERESGRTRCRHWDRIVADIIDNATLGTTPRTPWVRMRYCASPEGAPRPTCGGHRRQPASRRLHRRMRRVDNVVIDGRWSDR
jgi:hypothetical protein